VNLARGGVRRRVESIAKAEVIDADWAGDVVKVVFHSEHDEYNFGSRTCHVSARDADIPLSILTVM